MPNKQTPKRLISLAANPTINLADGDGEVDSWEDELDEAGVEKGRTVSGPRTKLASGDISADVAALTKSVNILAKSMAQIAKGQQQTDTRVQMIAKALGDEMFGDDMGGGDDYDPAADPMAVDEPDSFEDEGTLSLSNGGDASDIKADETGAMADTAGVGRDFNTSTDDYKDSQFNNARTARKAVARKTVAKGRADGRIASKGSAGRSLRKDDEATSFGEKDDDIPGNRPVDQTDRPEDQYILQGGSGAGPGPVSKAAFQRAVSAEVQKHLANAGLLRKSDGPGVGGDSMLKKSFKPVDVDGLKTDMSRRSFSEIAKFREEVGDLGRAF